jgi:PKD repeat protein
MNNKSMKALLSVVFGIILITLNFAVEIQLQPNNPVVGQEITFQLNGNTVTCTNCTWTFGDGSNKNNVDAGQAVKHFYKDSGNFNITITFNGCNPGDPLPAPISKNITVTDNRTVTYTPNNPKVGDQIGFTLNNAKNSSVKWDFGDNQIKPGNAVENHLYKNQGNFTVKAFDFGGTSQQPVTVSVNVVDNRVLVINPTQAKVGDEVTMTLQNAATQNSVKWNFGDNEIKNSQSPQKHIYKKKGNFNIKVFDFNGSAPQPITGSINIIDNRKIIVSPGQLRIGQQISFTLQDAVAQNIKWIFGDSKIKMGQKTEKHIYSRQGNFIVKAFDFNGNAQVPITITLKVIDDRRILMFPQNPRVGQIIKFSPQNFSSKNLSWQINHEPVRYGALFNYKCLSSGLHKLIVSETAGNVVLKKETTFNVTETRRVSWTPLNPKAGEEVKFTTSNFQFGRILWDFGDGFRNLNKTSTTHIFDRTGNYIVRVVDNSGRDAKEFTSRINIAPDPRVVQSSVVSVSAGEKVSLTARGFYDRNLQWDLGNGKILSAQQTLSHQFQQPGIYQIKVKDRAGKDKKAIVYQLQVKKDLRKITASKSSARVVEPISFEAVNFYDSRVKWDFGDGKVMVGGKQISHKFAKNGEYTVKAFDYGGQDSKIFKIRVKIQIARSKVSELMISGGEIFFTATGRNYTIVPEDYTKLNARVKLKFEGSGNLLGHWYLNGKKYLQINKNLSFGQAVTLELKSIPTMQPGLHILSFKPADPKSTLSLKACYFVSVGKEKIYLLAPEDKQVIKKQRFLFKWKNPVNTAKNRIHLSSKPKNLFKQPLMSVIVKNGQQKELSFAKSLKGLVYWYVESFDTGGKTLGISDIGFFKIE